MDIQKQRKVFQNQVSELNSFNLDEFTLSPFEWNAVDHEFYFPPTQLLWEAWQAAQAVPEGFVLIKSSDRDREICELIDQRDLMEMLADQLKDKLQDLYKVDFGEYTSCNCPLRNAIEYNDSDLVLVPKIPTRKMIDAGDKQIIAECVYKAMIEAQEQKG